MQLKSKQDIHNNKNKQSVVIERQCEIGARTKRTRIVFEDEEEEIYRGT